MSCWAACDQALLDRGRWPRAGCLLEFCLPELLYTRQLHYQQLPPTQALAARGGAGGHAAAAGSSAGSDERAPPDHGVPVWHAQALDGRDTLPDPNTAPSQRGNEPACAGLQPQTADEHRRRQRCDGGTAGLRPAIVLRLSTTNCRRPPQKALAAVNSLWSISALHLRGSNSICGSGVRTSQFSHSLDPKWTFNLQLLERFTSLLLMPVALSFIGVSPRAAARALREEHEEAREQGLGRLWSLLDRFTERRWATIALAVAALIGAGSFMVSQHLKIGDLDAGAPELRADSRYNRDNAYITSHYALSSDLFAVMVKTPAEGCLNYKTLILADRLGWALQQHLGVQATVSLADAVRQITAGTYEGNPKFASLQRNQDVLNYSAQQASVNTPELLNTECSVMPVIAFLKDHKARTLEEVTTIAEDFAKANSTPDRQFLLAAGSAGIEAATNSVVHQANRTMLLYIYGAVSLFCLITFRSWRATLVAMLPLVLTSMLCEALMVFLGIGVKVATLPVIALGVGIGVDYALYLLSVQLQLQRAGFPLALAYRQAVIFTGKVVASVDVTLAAGVITWAWSPIKFQADMGILLTFMFLWNMLGALLLIPALSHFLLSDRKGV